MDGTINGSDFFGEGTGIYGFNDLATFDLRSAFDL